MKLAKKITQIFSLIALIAIASSCKPQCYNNDEFDVNRVIIDSYPTSDNITGSYDSETGGQNVDWHNTGLKSNGDMFLIKISGAWTAWGGGGAGNSNLSESVLETMPVCNTCAKIDSNTPNCICYANQTPQGEFSQTCDPNDILQQNNPNLCTCTKDPTFGTALDYKVYHFPLNYYTKNETPQIADKQSECKFNRGMGAYIALFGRSGVTDPVRAYHLFTDDKDINGQPTAICDIGKNTNGECKDSSGRDRTSYVFRSANNRIFMKDDGEGNTGRNLDTSNDTYHGPNEVVKVKIYDQYYKDNFGKYNIDILRGVGDNGESSEVGILEYMVRLVENVLLGDLRPIETTKQIDGEEVVTTEYVRQGGIIEVMYKGIVQDSVFIRVLQLTLILYVAFYGLATLMGIAEINKKELMSRLVKISLVMFFTNQNSWYWYNKLVVGFFYDSMNYIVSLFMSLSDYALSEKIDTSALLVAQMDRSVDISNATRFSYVDNMIKMMLSTSFAAKVFSLLFSDVLGILYIYLIYRIVVFNFLKTMVHAATLYLTNMMKIIFVLCLGPIFIAFSLFAHTKNMFQNWLSFLGSRSLEIILIFAILYNFVMLIDLWIRDLLDYSACVESQGFGGILKAAGAGGLFSINILKAKGIADRNLVVWLTKIAKIAALIFITKLVLDKVMAVAGALISIGGIANKSASGEGHGQSGANMAAGLSGGLTGMADKMARATDPTFDRAKSLGGMVGGLTSKVIGGDMWGFNPLKSDLNPVKAGREAARNSLLDASINQAKKDVAGMKGADGKPLSSLDAAKAIRDQVAKKYGGELSKTAAVLGVTPERAAARVDQLFAKQLAGDLKAKGFMGNELKSQLRSGLQAYADHINPKNNSEGKAANKSMMDALSKTIDSESKIGGKEAAKLYADKPDLQNKYMQHLKDEEFKRQNRQGQMSALSRLASKAIDGMDRVRGLNPEKRNPEATQQTFLRNLQNNQNKNPNLLDYLNPANKSNTVNRMSDWISGKEGSLDARSDKSQTDLLRANLAQDQQSKPLAALRSGATEREKNAHAEAQKKLDETADKKRIFYQEQLRNLATKDLAKEISKINQLQEKGRFSDATKLKKELLKKEQEALKKNDGRTLFEKAARLDYLHKKFGIAGEDPTKSLSKALNKSATLLTLSIKDKIDSGAKTSSLIQEIGDLKDLRAGLFSTTPNKAVNSILEDLAKNQVPEFGTAILEDKKSKIDGDIEVNKDKKDTQKALDYLVKSIAEKGEKERKEAEEERKKDFDRRSLENFQLLQKIAKMKVEGKDEEVKAAMEGLKTKINEDSKNLRERREKDIKEFEKTFADFEKLENKNSKEGLAIAHNLSESMDAFVKAPNSLEQDVNTQIGTAIKNDASGSIIPGLQAPDLGLTAPDLGLKASNFLLGVSEEQNEIKNEAQQKDLIMQKNYIHGQMKMHNMNLKIKQFELEQLKNRGGSPKEISDLTRDISEIEKEISHLETEESKVNGSIK